MTTKFKSRGALLVSRGLFLALLLGTDAELYAENRATDRPADQTKEEETGKGPEEARRTDTTPDTAGLVGPSGEEIHDFLYPTAQMTNS